MNGSIISYLVYSAWHLCVGLTWMQLCSQQDVETELGLFVLRDIYNSYNGGEYMKWLTEFLDRVAEFLITGLICTILAGMWVYVLLYM